MRGDKNELEDVSVEASQSNTLRSDNSPLRVEPCETSMGIRLLARMAKVIACKTLIKIAEIIEGFVYRTYQGFGIILWLAVIGAIPMGFLWLIVSLSHPWNMALAFGAAFGFVCVSRSRWRHN